VTDRGPTGGYSGNEATAHTSTGRLKPTTEHLPTLGATAGGGHFVELFGVYATDYRSRDNSQTCETIHISSYMECDWSWRARVRPETAGIRAAFEPRESLM